MGPVPVTAVTVPDPPQPEQLDTVIAAKLPFRLPSMTWLAPTQRPPFVPVPAVTPPFGA
jgi:hypothetical protein